MHALPLLTVVVCRVTQSDERPALPQVLGAEAFQVREESAGRAGSCRFLLLSLWRTVVLHLGPF